MASGAAAETTPEARVLVVDDEDNIVELLSVSLKFQGFEVFTATNGPAALDRAREVRPDAVILDVMMPGMDGFGVLRRLRADGIDATALFLTARDSLQDKIAGLTLGGDDYVTKPFSLEEVVARLRVILRRAGKGTTEPRNVAAAQALWRAMAASKTPKGNPAIYLGSYSGWYAVRDEAFYDEGELTEGPDGGKLAPTGAPVACIWGIARMSLTSRP